MGTGSVRAAAGSWRDLAARAASAADRPDGARRAARTYEPELGDLDAFERARLVSSVEEIIASDASFVVPIHTSQPYWVPSMLDDGFRWTRPRVDVDGVPFEPYEDKLREYHALGRGERSEDLLFAEARLVPRNGGLEDSLAADAARFRAWYGVSSRTAPGFGDVTLAFDPDALIGATLLPATRLLGQFGTRAGTIEHLPGVIASRIAIEGGARMDVERSGLALHDVPSSSIAETMRWRTSYRRQLSGYLELGHDDRVRAVRGMMARILDRPHQLARHPIFKLNPVEAHVRGLEPAHVRYVDIEDGLSNLGRIAPARLDLIEAAAARRGVRVNGLEQHRQELARRLAEDPSAVERIRDTPRSPTAIGTASLRQRMASRRAETGAGAES